MLKLLLQPEQKKVRKEYFFRFAIVALSFSALLFLLLSVFLLPSYFLSRTKKKAVDTRKTSLQKSDVATSARKAGADLDDVKKKLSLLDFSAIPLRQSDLIELILKNKTASISLGNFIYKSGVKEGSVQISGTAESREALVSYLKKMQQEKIFSNVNFPVSNLTKDKNIDFFMTLTGKF